MKCNGLLSVMFVTIQVIFNLTFNNCINYITYKMSCFMAPELMDCVTLYVMCGYSSTQYRQILFYCDMSCTDEY